MVTTTEYAQLSAAAYESGGAGNTNVNWIRLGNAPPASPGFSASVYEKRTVNAAGETVTEIVIAYRGTDGPFDAVADIQLVAGGQPPQQFLDAKAYYNDIKSLYPNSSISVTGHSLGGAMASFVAADPLVTTTATAFNAPGIANLVPQGLYPNVTNYNTVFDPASNLPLNQIGSVWTVPVHTVNQLPLFFSPFSIFIQGLEFLLKQHSIASLVNADFTAAQRFIPRRDPLTLDLNNNGLETVPVNATNPVYFDLTGEGVQSSVGWVAPNDGFLVLDRNGDGLINDGTELFGDATPAYEAGTTNPSTGSGLTVDGFAALAQEDTNGDGIVNSGDANFANLRVWQDLNQDGVSQDGELKTLSELGIESFNVASINHSQLLANGNQIADTGTFTRMDGTSGKIGRAHV